jgi:hypothetical protein
LPEAKTEEQVSTIGSKTRKILPPLPLVPESREENHQGAEKAETISSQEPKTRKILHPPQPPVAESPPSEQEHRAQVEHILGFIEENGLSTIKTFLRESNLFEHIFREHLSKQIEENCSIEVLKSFFRRANSFLQEPETEIQLLSCAQSLIREEIAKELERYASVEYKHHFRIVGAGAKCKKILSSYLVYIAKTRFLVTADINQDMVALFPKAEENILQFICEYYWRHHSCFSIQELANTVANDLQRTTKRLL